MIVRLCDCTYDVHNHTIIQAYNHSKLYDYFCHTTYFTKLPTYMSNLINFQGKHIRQIEQEGKPIFQLLIQLLFYRKVAIPMIIGIG